MARVRKTQQGSRFYFRGDSRRDSTIPASEYAKRDDMAFMEYCQECGERYGLEAGKLGVRNLGTCGLCGGGDGFVWGRMSADDKRITDAINKINGDRR